MKRTSIIATLIAGVFALPLVATAAGTDKAASASTNQSSSANSASSSYGATARSEAFKTADTNSDGFISMEEAKGTLHATNFSTLDKNSDGKLSQDEHAWAKDHAGMQSGSNALGTTPSTTADARTTTK